MNRSELIKAYLDFFKSKGHAIIKSASLVPENDPTVLFTTAGMHPLVPYLLGQKHPMGTRLADVQKCIRTTDIEGVGDQRHLTFFEMLGNWSLGDYFKNEAIMWSYEFLIKILKFNPSKLHVTVFEGNKDIPRDEESADIWKKLGVNAEHIHYLPEDDNFWIQGTGIGPCGPCTEMFIDTGLKPCGPNCSPGCKCKKYLEIWNDVFMEYNKTKEGKYEKLKNKNVDTGMGVERALTILSNKDNVYETNLFLPVIKILEDKTGKKYAKFEKSFRVIMDHVRAATFILGDNKPVLPSNKDQGYVLRRLIRRAVRHSRTLGVEKGLLTPIAEHYIKEFKNEYPELAKNETLIITELKKEEEKFLETLEKGLHEFNKLSNKDIIASDAFLLYQSFGFPLEMITELAAEKGIKVDVEGFKKEYAKHQETSKLGSEQKFKGGLADNSTETTKLHTVAHLMLESLNKVLNTSVHQRGSNITPERLRFDFSFDRKMTPEELKKVEDLVNQKIKEGIRVVCKEMSLDDAKKCGARGEFEHKYGEKVKVYLIGEFSKEICGGPHAANTNELGHFKILKEEASSAGVRRIKAVLE
ncbi:Alanine--tRNA ligase [Candidatus Tiddalikarchaeum anstoanum]|nr:Alanine--tRNA ligase [Candidatus Tiddalikarchaeum anstoanum]